MQFLIIIHMIVYGILKYQPLSNNDIIHNNNHIVNHKSRCHFDMKI